MDDPKGSGGLVTALLERIMSIEIKGLDKIHKSLSQANLPHVFQHDDTVEMFTICACKTLYFIGLFYPVDQQCPEFQSVMEKWNKHEKMDISNQVDRVLRTEVLLLGSRATPLAIDLSWFSVVEFPSSTSSTIGDAARGRKSSSFGSGREEELDTTLSALGDFPFATLYARRMLHSGGAQLLFEASLKLMKNLPQRLKMGTATTVRSMSALMLMLTQILTEHPIADTAALRVRLLPPLEVFCQWPVPFGQLARKMRHMVEGEIRAPGTMYRKVLFEEHPMLSIPGMMKMSSVQSAKRAKQHTVWAELQHSVFVYYDVEDQRAVHLRNMLIDLTTNEHFNGGGEIISEEDDLEKKTLRIHHEMRKRCLRSMLECSLDLVHDLTNSEYTATEKSLILESGGWHLPSRGEHEGDEGGRNETKKQKKEKTEKKKKRVDQRGDRSSSISSNCRSSGHGGASKPAVPLDPLQLDRRDTASIATWYTRALDIYDAAAMDTTLPLTAYSQLRASKLIELLSLIDPGIVAIPTASRASHEKDDSLAPSFINSSTNSTNFTNSTNSTNSTTSHSLKRQESNVDKALKTARSVGKAARMFKKIASKSANSSTSSSSSTSSLPSSPSSSPSLSTGPPPPPSVGLGSNQLPLPVRNGFLVTHPQGLPPIQLEFQDAESALRPPKLHLYESPLVSRMEQERPVEKPVKNSTTQSKEEQRQRLARREKQHKEAMDAKYGHWKERCVIGPTKRRYLKYPEARYNPLAPMSGDLLVAALYAGSVDLSSVSRTSAAEVEHGAAAGRETQRRVGGVVGGGGDGKQRQQRQQQQQQQQQQRQRQRRLSSVSLRLDEEDFTIQHLSRTRASTEAQHVVAAAKEMHSVMDTSTNKSILRICVMGSNAILHRILCNYVCFRHEYEKRFSKLSIRLYVVPTARHNCDLATYLAREDAWYKRQVYSPFSTRLPIIPTVKEATAPPDAPMSATWWDDVNNAPPIPMNMLKELMQDYIRSARNIVSLCIFDCQCWEDEDDEQQKSRAAGDDAMVPPDVTIPFCVGAEIGIRARAELYRQKSAGTKLDTVSLDSILGTKDFRKTWSKDANDVGAVDDLSGSFTEVTPSGVPTSEKLLPDGSFYRIALRNVPMHADVVASRGSNSHPSFSSMDLHVLPRNAATFMDTLQKTSASSKQSHSTSTKETNAVVHTMLSEGFRQQVNHLDVKSSGAPFVVMLDGQCFGAFKRIRIVPCLSSKGEPQHFPVSTFSPIV